MITLVTIIPTTDKTIDNTALIAILSVRFTIKCILKCCINSCTLGLVFMPAVFNIGNNNFTSLCCKLVKNLIQFIGWKKSFLHNKRYFFNVMCTIKRIMKIIIITHKTGVKIAIHQVSLKMTCNDI